MEIVKYLTHIIISILSIFILLNIWGSYYDQKIRRINNENRDYGVILFVAALFIWGLIAVINLSTINVKVKESTEYAIKNLLNNFLSLINNALFLSAITYFDHGVEWANKSIRRRNIFIFISIFTFLLFMVIVILTYLNKFDACQIIDLIYTSLVFIVLMGVLYNSFSKRKLHGVAFVSLFVMVLAIIGQVFTALKIEDITALKIENAKEIGNTIFLASFAMMSSIFINLTYSWILEKATSLPYSDEILLEIVGKNQILELINQYENGKVEELKNNLKIEITKNNIEKVLQTLLIIFEKKGEKEDLNTVILLHSRLNEIEMRSAKGVVGLEEVQLEISKIKDATLKLIDKI